jgi:hypothetical protein
MQQITLLQVARQKGVHLTPNQLQHIGHQAGAIYRGITGNKPEKVPQAEDGQLFEVNAYPQEFEPVLTNLLQQAIQVSYQKVI